MAVLLTELDRSDVNDLNIDDAKEDISLLNKQVTRCKNSLAELTLYYNRDSSESNLPVLLSVFSADVKDYIINIHPTSKIDFDTACAPDIKVASDLSLKHAIINIIEKQHKGRK
ncbi:MAG: hypothetical protein ACJAS2_001938 [Pseudohongiellaceae bacterium]|jgi:hypothetical protein